MPSPANDTTTTGFGFGDRRVDVTDAAVQFGDEVALRVGDPGGGVLVAVHQRGTRCVRLLRVEYCGQLVIFDDDQRARRLGDLHRLRDDRGDALPAEPRYGVEHRGVVGIVEPMHMASG